MTNWIGREMRPGDMRAVAPLLERAQRPASVFVRAAYARGSAFGGWWYGVWRDGQTLEAVMAVDNYLGTLYAENEEAARGLGEQLYAAQRRLGPTGQAHRHQLIGEAKTMSIVWPIVKDVPDRKLVFDRECDLLQAMPADATAAPSSRVTLDLAQRADERIVYDFAAEQRIEQMGVDPRKAGRDAHQQRVVDLVAYGRELIAKEKDSARPFFVGELAELSSDTTLLTDAWVPPHYRARGKLIAQAFWAAARHPAVAGKELVYLSSDSTYGIAAKSAGWKRISGFRWCVTHG